MYAIFFILSSAFGHLGLFPLLAEMSHAAVNMGVQISESLLSLLLDIYSQVELLDPGNFMFNFRGFTMPFSSVPFYIPAGSTQVLQFLCILSDTCYLFVFDNCHPDGCDVDISFESLFSIWFFSQHLPGSSPCFELGGIHEK